MCPPTAKNDVSKGGLFSWHRYYAISEFFNYKIVKKYVSRAFEAMEPIPCIWCYDKVLPDQFDKFLQMYKP